MDEELEVLFESRRLMSIAKAVFPLSGYLQKTYFSIVDECDEEKIDIILKKGSKTLAPFVSPLVAGKVMTSGTRSMTTYAPAYIKQKYITKATDILGKQNVPIYHDDESPIFRVAEKITEELAGGNDAIERRVEWMAAQVLQTGLCPVKGDGIDEVIDCLFEDNQITALSGTDKWTEEGSSPMKTFRTIRKRAIDAGGKAPDRITLGSNLYEVYLNHPETKEMFKENKIDRGNLKTEMIEEGVIRIGYIPEILTTIEVYDETFTNDDGDVEHYLNPNKFIYGSTKAEGRVVYGCIKDMTALYATKVHVKSQQLFDPSGYEVLQQSAPVVIPTYKDSYHCCQPIAGA